MLYEEQMRALAFVAIVLCGCASSTGVASSPSVVTSSGNGARCPATTPPPVLMTPPPPAETGSNPGLVFQPGPNEFLYGNDALVVALPNDGTIHPSDPSRGLPGGVKFPWDRIAHGTLVVTTQRLDAVTAPQPAVVPSGYGDTGFQPSGLYFAAPGCWQVSGSVDGKTLTFVVRVAAP